jgi:multidrug efflux system outer membrane protein
MSKIHHLLCVSAGLSGCTLIPNYQRPDAPVSSTYPGDPNPGSGIAADLPWHTFFAENRLKKLIQLALANNRDLRVAVLNVEKSQAQYRVTKSSSYPGVDAGGSYSRSHAAGATLNYWNANIGSTAYEVDLFGKVRSLNEQALETYLATTEAQRSARISLVSEVAAQYFSICQAEEQLKLARQTLAVVQGSYDLNKARLNAGESNELDFRTAEGQVQNAEINILTYERLVAQGYNALTLLVGQPLPSNLPPSRSLGDTGILANIPAGLPSDLVKRRPDILQAERTLRAANANIGAARAAYFPSVTLTGSAGSTSSDFSKLFSGGTGSWSFSPQINVPIFSGGQNTANLNAAKVSTRIEVANYEKSIQTAFREVADALVATGSYSKQANAQSALIDSQQKRFDLANSRYLQGEDSYLNVLSAQQDLYGARQGLIDSQYNTLVSRVSLYKALGGGWK